MGEEFRNSPGTLEALLFCLLLNVGGAVLGYVAYALLGKFAKFYSPFGKCLEWISGRLESLGNRAEELSDSGNFLGGVKGWVLGAIWLLLMFPLGAIFLMWIGVGGGGYMWAIDRAEKGA